MTTKTPLRLADLKSIQIVLPEYISKGRAPRGPVLSIGYTKSDSCRSVNMSKEAFLALGEPEYVQILAADGRILVVRGCKPTDQGARPVDRKRRARAHELIAHYDIGPGDRYYLAASLDEGNVIADVGDELVLRAGKAKRRREAQATP